MCLLKGTVAGSCNWGILERFLGEGCCLLWRDGERGCEGGNCARIRLWRKARQPRKQGNITESHVWGWSNHHSLFLPTYQHRELNNRQAGPSNPWLHWTTEQDPTQGAPLSAWCTKLESNPTHDASLSAWCTDLQSRTPAREVSLCADTLNNREGFQATKPSKCLNGWN